ncbi:copper resistance CopC family protein [Microbispora triticiradicis]|uniref:copper resistance CopC family protein n=1 Tax=Microbispora triticiradicis TaxID=2200763 RepID=UPI001FCDCBED|nr:copper resistance protein CopC [Microbispora triticiradicis]
MARWLGRLLLPVVVGVLTLAALAAPASAHGQLAMSTPAKDSTVKTPLESLRLYFTEAPAPNAYFTVTAPNGARVDQAWTHGQPERLDKPVQEYNLVNGVWEPSVYNTGFPAVIPVAYWPEQGEYVVHYLSVASDGEPVEGDLRFTYKGKTSAPPKGWKAPTNEPDAGLLSSAEPGSGATANATPESGGSALGPVAPSQASTGSAAGPAAVPETGAATAPAARTAAGQDDSGTGLSVWLVPALLVAGAGALVLRAARRPAPSTGAAPARTAAAKGQAAKRPSGRPRPKTPTSSSQSRTANRPRSAKRR